METFGIIITIVTVIVGTFSILFRLGKRADSGDAWKQLAQRHGLEYALTVPGGPRLTGRWNQHTIEVRREDRNNRQPSEPIEINNPLWFSRVGVSVDADIPFGMAIYWQDAQRRYPQPRRRDDYDDWLHHDRDDLPHEVVIRGSNHVDQHTFVNTSALTDLFIALLVADDRYELRDRQILFWQKGLIDQPDALATLLDRMVALAELFESADELEPQAAQERLHEVLGLAPAPDDAHPPDSSDDDKPRPSDLLPY